MSVNGIAMREWRFAAALGLIPGVTQVHKFGRIVAVGATEAVVSSLGTSYGGFLTAATTVRVKAGGNAADAAAGAGARKVVVAGLDENWADASEEITLNANGTLASAATTTAFVRVFRAYVTDCGTYASTGANGANVGAITIEASGGGADLIQIAAQRGQSQLAAYTVPAGYTAYLTDLFVQAEGTKAPDVYLWQRRNADDVTAPHTARRLVQGFGGVAGEHAAKHGTIESYPAKTDLYATALVSTSTADVTVEFELFLIPD